MRRKIFIVLMLIWLVVIFSFSAKDADKSTKESNAVGMVVGSIVHPDFDTWTEEKRQEFADRWDHPVRKGAHMTEYAILGFLAFGAYLKDKTKWKKSAFVAFVSAAGYAVTDEIHQYFVPGRACMITDVGFDSVGAAVGCMASVMLFIGILRKRVKN